MREYKGQERRKAQRAPLTTFCPVTFCYTGESYGAFMVDVSNTGAGFRLESHGVDLKLEEGKELLFHVKTPYGDSNCSGIIQWAVMDNGYCTWGVNFTQLSRDESDPLRCLIDSSF